MARVIAGMAMSLEGFVADRHGSVARLYPDFAALRERAFMRELSETTGAVVMGYRSYQMANDDYTGYEFQVPLFVLTRRAPEWGASGTTSS